MSPRDELVGELLPVWNTVYGDDPILRDLRAVCLLHQTIYDLGLHHTDERLARRMEAADDGILRIIRCLTGSEREVEGNERYLLAMREFEGAFDG